MCLFKFVNNICMLIMNIDNYMYNCIYSVYYIYYIMDRVLFVLMVFNLVSLFLILIILYKVLL